MVEFPRRIVVERGMRCLGEANRRNPIADPSQLAPALAAPLPSALSPRFNSRLGFPGKSTLVGATSYKLQDAPPFKSRKPPHVIAKGRIEKETDRQTAHAELRSTQPGTDYKAASELLRQAEAKLDAASR